MPASATQGGRNYKYRCSSTLL